MQVLPHLLPSSTPLHVFGGSAGLKRNAPTGGAAKGMPLNTVTPAGSAGAPLTRPCLVFTGPVMAACPVAAMTSMDDASAMLIANLRPLIGLFPSPWNAVLAMR